MFTQFEEEQKLNQQGKPIEQESSGLDISYNTSMQQSSYYDEDFKDFDRV